MNISLYETLADNEELLAFAKHAFAAGIFEGAFEGGGTGPVGTESVAAARDDSGKLIGIALYHGIGTSGISDMLWLYMVWVEPAARRQTVGSRLVSAVIAAAQRANLALQLGVLPGNDDAARLYESLGFRLEMTVYQKDPVA